MQAPVCASHIQALKSAAPASTTLPLGCQATHSTASAGPSRVATHRPRSAPPHVHTLTRPAGWNACGVWEGLRVGRGGACCEFACGNVFALWQAGRSAACAHGRKDLPPITHPARQNTTAGGGRRTHKSPQPPNPQPPSPQPQQRARISTNSQRPSPLAHPPSMPPVASRLPSALNARQETVSVCPPSSCTAPPLSSKASCPTCAGRRGGGDFACVRLQLCQGGSPAEQGDCLQGQRATQCLQTPPVLPASPPWRPCLPACLSVPPTNPPAT